MYAHIISKNNVIVLVSTMTWSSFQTSHKGRCYPLSKINMQRFVCTPWHLKTWSMLILHSKTGNFLLLSLSQYVIYMLFNFFQNLKLFFNLCSTILDFCSRYNRVVCKNLRPGREKKKKKERERDTCVWYWADIEQIEQWGPRERRILIMVSPSSLPRSSVLLFFSKHLLRSQAVGCC